MTTNINTVLQRLEPDTKVDLFKLDATALGAGVLLWTTTPSADAIMWRGNSYPYVPMEASGFEISGQGSPPRPKIEVSNLDSIFTQLVRQYGDLVGSILTRTRTFARYLDDGDEPALVHLPLDIYRVDQKSSQDNTTIVWELSPFLNVQGQSLPRRQCLRDTCLHTYRKYVDGSFSYANVSCPYTGDDMFQRDGTVTSDPAEDECGKHVSDCKLRFGEHELLPTRAFPGIARAR